MHQTLVTCDSFKHHLTHIVQFPHKCKCGKDSIHRYFSHISHTYIENSTLGQKQCAKLLLMTRIHILDYRRSTFFYNDNERSFLPGRNSNLLNINNQSLFMHRIQFKKKKERRFHTIIHSPTAKLHLKLSKTAYFMMQCLASIPRLLQIFL